MAAVIKIHDLQSSCNIEVEEIQKKTKKYHVCLLNPIDPIGAGGGGLISPYHFQMSISPWKKGSGGPKFRDFFY